MSTQINSSSDALVQSSSEALDRTDELPILDVEAYEASLAESQRGLSRTDTWTVEALRDIDELVESVQHEAIADVRNLTRESVGAEALTVNVDRILKRIADLEADIVAAHEANAALQKRNEAIQADRDQQAARLEALELENARLAEHRALADEMAKRFEQQLREQSQRADEQLRELALRSGAQLEGLQSTRAAERAEAEEKHARLERQIAQMATDQAALQQEIQILQERAQTAQELADHHAQSLIVLERTLGEEKARAAEMSRRFAAKLTDYDKLVSIVELRNHSIDELTRVRDELTRQLEREAASALAIGARLAAAEESLTEYRAIASEHESVIAQRDEERSKWQEELDGLRRGAAAAELAAREARDELSAAAAARAEEDRRRLTLQAELIEARNGAAALAAERDAALAEVLSLSAQRDAMLPATTELAARTAEVEQAARDIAQLRNDLAAARREMAASARAVAEKENELSAAQTKLQEYETALRSLQLTIEARDEIVDGLRTHLQTVQDEHAIMADQRDKARARTKHLTQEIFRRDQRIADLEADLAVHSEALAAIRRDVSRIGERTSDSAQPQEVERILEPVGHPGPPIVLAGTMLTLGRTHENDICLPSKLVSRHHARLLIGPTGIIVEDAGSTNGCFVNGEQVRQHLMHDGDVLELGDMRYRLRTRPAHGTSANVVPLFDSQADD